MTSGTDVLDALIAGVNIVELDPEDASVGYGGRPNADGVVQTGRLLHARAEAAGPAGVAALEGVRTAVQSGAEGRRSDRSPPARGRRRAAVRPADGVRHRGRPQHGPVAPDVAGMEAPHRSRPLPGSGSRRESRCRGPRTRRRPRDAGLRRAHRGGAVRHHQLRRHQCRGRDLRGHHNERAGVEDPGPGGRFTDPGRRTVRRQRGRRRRLHRARGGQSVQPSVLSHRRAHAGGGRIRGMPAWRRCAACRATRSNPGC